ncbi:MAG: TetR/AcrR family transcriptional regulator [Chloroflexi bacterium CFX4]|nr:TetR/AcrR family transcriptional regulator [Chloroflexi bacterium CFX4]MDL1923708.1 TetR/AcrR family transcriptional regulator [Chloroflexi bacterium CFX3]
MPRKPADQTVHRTDILQAAATVFRERGYAGATMADIARRVRLTAGSLYHHFPAGKQDLLLAVLNVGMDNVLAQLESILAQNLPPDETLRQMITAHALAVTQNVSVGAAMVFEIRTLISLAPDDPSAAERDAFLARRATFERHFRTVIERGIQRGVFRQVEAGIFTKALLGAQNWISVWYREDGKLNGAQIAAHMAETFLAALGCPKNEGST